MAEMQNVLRFEITPSNIIFIDRNGNVQENEFEFSVIKHEKSFGSHVQENAVLPHISCQFRSEAGKRICAHYGRHGISG